MSEHNPTTLEHVKELWPFITGMSFVLIAALRLWWNDRVSIGGRLDTVEMIAHTNRQNTEYIIDAVKELKRSNDEQHQFLIDKLIDK